MKAPQKALLLVGSPKPGESTSESLGVYLFEALEKRGVETQTLHVTKAVRSDESREGLLAAVASSDLVVLSFPLYVDCLPGPAIRALELIAGARAGSPAAGAPTGDALAGVPRHLPVRLRRGGAQRGGDRDLPQLRAARPGSSGPAASSCPRAA